MAPSTAVRRCRLGKLPPPVELPFSLVTLFFHSIILVSTGSKNRAVDRADKGRFFHRR